MQKDTESNPWPDSLKEFIGKCIQDAEENNHVGLQDEVKILISRQYENGNIWNIDWSTMNLDALRKLTAIQDQMQEDKKRKLDQPSNNSVSGDQTERAKKEKRKRRFLADERSSTASTPVEPEKSINDGAIVGRSTALEKRYLRLTSDPDPNTIRPLPILKQTLELLKRKWKEEKNYAYICDQFKSLRQDLTVQRIQNDFSALVYEIHARIALEKGDVGEYNQCQTQLFHLYGFGVPGKVKEFLAYRILYILYTKNRSEMNSLLANLADEEKEDPAVQHALEVRSAIATADYYKFFQLYLSAPNMGGYLMDLFVERERVNAMYMISKAYRPSVPVDFIANTLAFEDMDECRNFLIDCQSLFDPNDSERVLMKESIDKFDAIKKKHTVVDIKGQI
ncbi:SAC3/GANP/THP3 family protein, LENG8-like protein [Schizosaccharomyces osmophilus]|uniref:SAC3/GANP/THP3 family protein, LENG8-like protein n=1 Tax=Schizosaccharomyces osmophilus TaxID=2545709 RepID=A0AAE9WAV1_9SCHI|nr:SAC3/GANP/THP3 family protein, LENG8-like protein [Schizosaccharomyces osmophilus]WBW72896.1 SAC3/GANP/THP3 family protein, LENG8-like protein [Schizosaccharomyces osmophilus]